MKSDQLELLSTEHAGSDGGFAASLLRKDIGEKSLHYVSVKFILPPLIFSRVFLVQIITHLLSDSILFRSLNLQVNAHTWKHEFSEVTIMSN